MILEVVSKLLDVRCESYVVNYDDMDDKVLSMSKK